MTGETGRLYGSQIEIVHHSKKSYIGESFLAGHMLALMWFLAGMGANVNCESTPLDEALSTPRSHTRVGPIIGVYAIMSLQIGLAVEALRSHISGPVQCESKYCVPYCMSASHTESA